VRHVLEEIYSPGRKLQDIEQKPQFRGLIVLTDSHNLRTNLYADTGLTVDKRLRIIVAVLREYYHTNQKCGLAFIPTWLMLADGLTKLMLSCWPLRQAASAHHKKISPPSGKYTVFMGLLSQLPHVIKDR